MDDHTPVLLEEIISLLDVRPGIFVIDGTINGGGHAEAVLNEIGKDGKLLGVDLDPSMLEASRRKLGNAPNVDLEKANYADLAEILRKKDLPKADAVLLDLGFSSRQIDKEAGRGFSFSEDNKEDLLRMTYDPDDRPAYEILREMSEEEIADMIYTFGGERLSRRIAKAIYAREQSDPIVTSGELSEVVRGAVPGGYERGRIDPATRTFQALRIYANQELENLKKFLKNIEMIVAPGGRVAIISFHSLEDRIVKLSFRAMKDRGIAEILTKKPVTASEDEIEKNVRSRSAKLRAIRLKK